MEKNEMEKTADKLEQLLHDGNKAYTKYCNIQNTCLHCKVGSAKNCTIRFIAEYMAENGVTVREDGQP